MDNLLTLFNVKEDNNTNVSDKEQEQLGLINHLLIHDDIILRQIDTLSQRKEFESLIHKTKLADLFGLLYYPEFQKNFGFYNDLKFALVFEQLLHCDQIQEIRNNTLLNTESTIKVLINLVRFLATNFIGNDNLSLNSDAIENTKDKKESFKNLLSERASKKISNNFLPDIFDDKNSIFNPGAGGATILNSNIDLDTLKKLLNKLKNNRILQQVLTKYGKLKNVLNSKHSRSYDFLQDEMIGIKNGKDISKLLKTEIALTDDEDLEILQLLKLAENKTYQEDWEGKLPIGKGPIVICIDESGSMENLSITSKALALYLIDTAHKQRRWVGIVRYSGEEPENEFSEDCTCVFIKPGINSRMQVLDFISDFFGGGSGRDIPLLELPTIFDVIKPPKGKTDLIMISDFKLYKTAKKYFIDFNNWQKVNNIKTCYMCMGNKGEDISSNMAENDELILIDEDLSNIENYLEKVFKND